jgi:hypothetical protein
MVEWEWTNDMLQHEALVLSWPRIKDSEKSILFSFLFDIRTLRLVADM